MKRLTTSQLNKIEKMLKNKKVSIKDIALSVGVSVQAIHNHANKNGWDTTRDKKPTHWNEQKISLRLRELHALCIERDIESRIEKTVESESPSRAILRLLLQVNLHLMNQKRSIRCIALWARSCVRRAGAVWLYVGAAVFFYCFCLLFIKKFI